MSGRPRRHPITDSIKQLKEGDNVLVRRRKGTHFLEMPVTKINRVMIVCEFGSTERKFMFHRITGKGHNTEYHIVACGAADIEKFRKNSTGTKRVRKSICHDFTLEPPTDSAALPTSDKYRGAAEMVARRVYLHFSAGQFEACHDVIRNAAAAYEAEATMLREAKIDRGVGHSLSLLGFPQKLCNAFESFGIHTIAELCTADRNYLLDHVPQVSKKRLRHVCKLLDFHGFDHKLHEPDFYKAVKKSEVEDEEPDVLSFEDYQQEAA